jgi:hypothetical protein
MGMWVRTEMDPAMWDKFHQSKEMVELIQSGPIERLEPEIIDGRKYYVVRLNPSNEKIIEMVSQQQDIPEEFMEEVNIERMIDHFSSTVWIDADTMIMERSFTNTTWTIRGEDMDEDSSASVRLRMAIELALSDINQPVDIVLPEAAKEAMDMSEMEEQYMGRSAVTGSAISDLLEG